jgi:hypothetical protein
MDSIYALDEAGLERLVTAIESSLPIETAVELSGISFRTFTQYVQDAQAYFQNDKKASQFSPQYCEFLDKFLKAIVGAKARGEQDLVDQMRKHSKNSESATIFLLTNLYPEHWSKRPDLRNRPKDLHTLVASGKVDPKELTEDQLDLLVEGEIIGEEAGGDLAD